jgi:hypothetical protein
MPHVDARHGGAPIGRPLASVWEEPERAGAGLAAILEPDPPRARRNNPPEAPDITAATMRADAVPRLAWDRSGLEKYRRKSHEALYGLPRHCARWTLGYQQPASDDRRQKSRKHVACRSAVRCLLTGGNWQGRTTETYDAVNEPARLRGSYVGAPRGVPRPGSRGHADARGPAGRAGSAR